MTLVTAVGTVADRIETSEAQTFLGVIDATVTPIVGTVDVIVATGIGITTSTVAATGKDVEASLRNLCVPSRLGGN